MKVRIPHGFWRFCAFILFLEAWVSGKDALIAYLSGRLITAGLLFFVPWEGR